MVSHNYSLDGMRSKLNHHRIILTVLSFFQMSSILIGEKNWLSYGRPKRLGQKSVGSWGPVITSIRLVRNIVLQFNISPQDSQRTFV